MIRRGRTEIRCGVCGDVCATISEAKLQAGASFTPWKGRTAEQLSQVVTDNAAVACVLCERVAARKQSQA